MTASLFSAATSAALSTQFCSAYSRPAKVKLLWLSGLMLLMTGCTSVGEISNQQRNQFVTTFYATVADVRPIQFESHAQEAAAMGAVEGALFNFGDDDMLFSALFGAVFSGMAVSIFEGDLNGLEVGLEAVDGDYVIVTTEQDNLMVGDCVNVRVGSEVEMYHVSPIYCSSDI
jgi:outer membrane lipoprotein SlyB